MRRSEGEFGCDSVLFGFSNTSMECMGSGFIHCTSHFPGCSDDSMPGLSRTVPSGRRHGDFKDADECILENDSMAAWRGLHGVVAVGKVGFVLSEGEEMPGE